MKEPVLIIKASEPGAPELIRAMVDHRRRQLAAAPEQNKAALQQLTAYDELADDMEEWLRLTGRKIDGRKHQD